jgi:hypothetical protein
MASPEISFLYQRHSQAQKQCKSSKDQGTLLANPNQDHVSTGTIVLQPASMTALESPMDSHDDKTGNYQRT